MNTPLKIWNLPNYQLSSPIELEGSFDKVPEGMIGNPTYRVSAMKSLGIEIQAESYESYYDAIAQMAAIVQKEYEFLAGLKEQAPLGRLEKYASNLYDNIHSHIERKARAA